MDPAPMLLPVVQALEELGIAYQIGGSLASSVWGLPRSTQDADLTADLRQADAALFVTRLQDAYYVDIDAVTDAIHRHGAFNLIHLDTMFKVDVFIYKPSPFEDSTFSRAQRHGLGSSGDQDAVFTSPEDIVLHKLRWYKSGGGVSERQWLDVLGVLKVQGSKLDQTYMTIWAIQLGLDDLMNRALEESGL